MSYYAGDPLTAGRNAFAVHFEASSLVPAGARLLPPDERFFPGGEVVRGFTRGALSPWAAGASGVRPTGADTLGVVSAEYRIPLYGPVHSVLFGDLGWSRIGVRQAPARIDATNGLFRASLGGEVRLDLPWLHQPARLIFAWNPLRLDTWIDGSGAPVHLADPRRIVRFALGNPF